MKRFLVLLALLLFPLSGPAADETFSDRVEEKRLYIAHLALSACDKGRWNFVWNKCWETDVVLRNKSVRPLVVQVLWHASDGHGFTVLVHSSGHEAKAMNSEQGPLAISVPPLGVAVHTFTLPLVERSLFENMSDWPSEAKSGWMSFETSSPDEVEVFALFRFKTKGNVVNQAYAPLSVPATRFTSYLRRAKGENGIPVDMGFAIANPNHSGATVKFVVRDQDGKEIKLPNPFSTFIPAMGQTAEMLSDLVYFAQHDLVGSLEIVADVPVVVVALQMVGKKIAAGGEAVISTVPVTTP